MMDCTALYFPGTSPTRLLVEALLLVHEAVCWYQPMEGIPLGELEPLARRGLVKVMVPAPLGEERQRFELTVRDLLAHGQSYQGAYLATMAAATEPNQSTPRWALADELKTRQAEVDQELWQARLLLQLQEIVDRQEREISHGLSSLAKNKNALLSALRGEAPAGAVVRPERPASLSPARAEQLLRAWTRLFLVDQAPDRPALLVTDQEGAAALLLADCEKFFKKGGQPVLELVLPSLSGLELDDFLARLASFQQHAATLLLELRSALLDMAGEPGDEVPAAVAVHLAGLATSWGEKVAAHFGPASGTAAVLVFYRLPGVPLARLLAQRTLGDGQPTPGAAPASGIMGVVEMRG